MPLSLLLACTASTLGEPGLVLLDAEALDAGWAVDVDGAITDGALPIATWSDEVVLIAPDDGVEFVELYSGELLLVQGAGGSLEVTEPGVDVARDTVFVEGSEDAAWDLADQVGADVVELEGEWELHAPDLIEELCWAEEPRDLRALRPARDAEILEAEYDRQLADIEQQVRELKERVFASKARLGLLHPPDYGASLPPADGEEASQPDDFGALDPVDFVGVWHSGDACVLLDASGGYRSCDFSVEGLWSVSGGLLMIGEGMNAWIPDGADLHGIPPVCDDTCTSMLWSRP